TGDLRFSVKGLRFDGQFSGPATLIKPTQLTIAQIAEQLVSIEQARGYEQARYAAKQLDYDAICALVHHRNLDDNDPNLMPSRFMLLPGASDEQLKANDNLNAFPWPVHQDGPQYFSVAFLKQCLQLSGHLDSDEALPRWSSVADDRKDEFDHTIHPILPATNDDANNIDESPNERQAEFDDTLKAAYDQYRQDHGVKKSLKQYQPKEESRYTVKTGDTLHSIADAQGYPYWSMVWQANQHTLTSPGSLTEGTLLTLPELNADALLNWLTDQDEVKRYWSQKGFFFPANYVAYSLLNDKQPLEGLDEQPEWVAGQRNSDHHRFYHLSLNQHACTLMMPNDQTLLLGLVRGQPFSSAQALRRIAPLASAIQNTTDTSSGEHTQALFFEDDLDYPQV
ncbi:MAG: LysM peptidoglycan-binding domain-containing protein, partial [Reinekea sp.]